MQTRSGRQYWPLDPRPDDVDLGDIAAHLSKICRFGGAVSRFYSVAEHSVIVSRLVPNWLETAALLHDAAEAYCQDIVRPIKRFLPKYAEIEARNERAIFERFSVPRLDPDDRDAIKHADNAALLAEQAAFMGPPPAAWDDLGVCDGAVTFAGVLLEGLDPARAESAFLNRAAALGLS